MSERDAAARNFIDRTRTGRAGRSRSRALLLPMLLLAAACGTFRGGDSPFSDGEGSNQVSVTVENQNFYDATLYAHWDGSARIRMGRVTGNSTETFTIEWRGGTLRLEADFLAGRSYLSEPISVARGDHLEYTLRP